MSDVGDIEAWAMVESSPDGMLLVDEGGVILTANAQIELAFGYDRSELLGQKVEQLVPERHRQVHTAHRTRYRAAPTSRPMGTSLDLWGRRKDGTEFPVEVSLSPVEVEGKVRVVATVRDITERRAAEALAHLVNHSIDAAVDGVFMFPLDTLQFNYVNQGACQQLGYTKDELLGMTPLHIKPEFTEAGFREMLKPVVTGDVASHTFCTVHRRKCGIDVPVEVVIEYPEASHPDENRILIAIVRDITERTRAESERERQSSWIGALADIRSSLLAENPIEQVLETVCGHACSLVAASDAFIIGGIPAAAGDHRDQALKLRVSLEAPWLQMPTNTTDPRPELASLDLGPVIIAPMSDVNNTVSGALLVGRLEGDEPFDETELELVKTLAHEATSAITVSRTRASSARLALLEERERIAGDLHDMVIQRLFATGMSLQLLQSLVEKGEVGERLGDAVSELDGTISEIRSTIFRLSSPATTVRGELETVVRSAVPSLGFAPELTIEGDPERISEAVAAELIPTLTEALANVARHARATEAKVEIDVEGDKLSLRVSDDGIGIDQTAPRGNGIDNMATRARRLNGSFRFSTNASGGTTLIWSVTG